MHSVQRSPEPDFLAQIRIQHSNYDQLDRDSRWRIRDALIRDFGLLCAYCEQPCQLPTRGRALNEAEIEHFRPRDKFPELWLDWLNLVLACRRCNQKKSGEWPIADDMKNRTLAAAHSPRYTPVSEYVNPNETAGRRPAHEFFDWDIETGKMMPAESLDRVNWSIARRTIFGIDLNDDLSDVELYDPNHLLNKRRYHLYLLIQGLSELDDPALKARMIHEFTLPDKPFSAFVSAYRHKIGDGT